MSLASSVQILDHFVIAFSMCMHPLFSYQCILKAQQLFGTDLVDALSWVKTRVMRLSL